MFSRSAKILLLAFQVVWLTAILPGHTRGLVLLAGAEADGQCHAVRAEAEGKAHACCPAGKHDESDQHPTKSNRAANCAVCHLAVRMVIATAPDLAPRPSGLADNVPPAMRECPLALPLQLAYHSRGPPARLIA